MEPYSNSASAWLSAQTIKKAYGNNLTLEDFRNTYALGGIDLSQTTDLTAACVLIERAGVIWVFAHFWLPAERIAEATKRDGVPYEIMIKRGLVTASGDAFVDYKDCEKWFIDLVQRYKIFPLMTGYDRYSAQYLVQDLNSYGFQMDDVYQGENLYPVIQETQGLLEDGKIHIGDNDLLKMHLLNSAVKMSVERGRGRLVKINPNDHIDGVAALLCAMCVRQKRFAEIGESLKNEDTEDGTV